MNTREPIRQVSLAVALPFLLRKTWTWFVPRSGAPRRVPVDPSALTKDPSVTWIGHSTLLVRMNGITFLTDPMFGERASPLPFGGPRRLVPPAISVDALPAVDFATLSHDHYDHTDLPSIRALASRGVHFIVPLGLGELVRDAGGTVEELAWWEHTTVGSVRVHCVPAQHFSGRGLSDRGQRLWSGWVVESPTRRFYHAGDTGYFDGFQEIYRRFGRIDLAAIPIGAYLPEAMMGPVHLNPEQAVSAARDLRARLVIGIHFGTFDLTDEPIDEPPVRFRAAAARQGISDRAWIFEVGETRSW